MDSYAYVWEFLVRPEKAMLFERLYGPEGDWVALFRRAEGYIDTLLLKDRDVPSRYVTVDRWESEGAYQRFRKAFADDYRALDERAQELTVRERSLGVYAGPVD